MSTSAFISVSYCDKAPRQRLEIARIAEHAQTKCRRQRFHRTRLARTIEGRHRPLLLLLLGLGCAARINSIDSVLLDTERLISSLDEQWVGPYSAASLFDLERALLAMCRCGRPVVDPMLDGSLTQSRVWRKERKGIGVCTVDTVIESLHV